MPTRAEYINYALSLVGYYGAGAGHGENNTPFNTWYYGQTVSGENWSWCRVFECYVDNHFDMLSQNGGKSAYVPAMVHGATAKVWHKPKRGSVAYKPGNKVCYDFNRTGEAEHTGFFWKTRDSSSFWAVEGNTGNDQVAKRIRFYSDVLDVIETVGFASESTPTKAGNDVPDYVSLTTKTSIPVQPDAEFFVQFDKENSDSAKRHVDSPSPGIFVAGKNGSVYSCAVEVNGPATWTLCEMRKEDNEWKQHDHTTGNGPDLLDADSHLWLKVSPHAVGEVVVNVKCAVWDR